MQRFLLYILFSVLSVSTMLADNVTITVDAETTVEVNSNFRVRFTINTQDISNFQAPDFKGLEVVYGPATSRQTSMQSINGKVTQSSTISFTYTLTAMNPGQYTIGPATVQSQGKVIKSKPVTIKVVKGRGGNTPPAGNQGHNPQPQRPQAPSPQAGISANDLFMTATASKTRVYEQEALLVTYKVYTTLNLVGLEGKLPTLDGFQIQEVPLPQTKQLMPETYNGRQYFSVVWSQYVLFPQKTGKLTIPSISYDAVVRYESLTLDPFDAMMNGFNGVEERKKQIQTPELSINVSPLPEKPADFSGAVGKFSIRSSVNNQDVLTGDAVKLKLDITGSGNLKLITAPKVNFPSSFESYTPKENDDYRLGASNLEGTKTIDYLAVPRNPGSFTIPAISFTYFDPDARAYKTLTTEPYTIDVKKGKGNAAQDIADFSKQDVQELNQDIRYIKQGKVRANDGSATQLFTLNYLLWYLVPLVVFVVLFMILRRQHQDNANVGELKKKKANKVARKRLKLAASLLQQKRQNEFYDEVLKALYGYITDKLHMPQVQLSKDNVEAELSSRGVNAEMISSFIAVINDCEFARYAPGNPEATMENVFEKAVSLISQIEKELK